MSPNYTYHYDGKSIDGYISTTRPRPSVELLLTNNMKAVAGFFFILWTFVSIVKTTLANYSAADNIKEDHDCVGGYCLPKNYSKLTMPGNDFPLQIQMVLDIQQILEVDDLSFTVTLCMIIGMIWKEPRLLRPDDVNNDHQASFKPLHLDFLDLLWTPDIYIRDMKSLQTNSILSKFAGLLPFNESSLYYSEEAIITLWCPMRFDTYPFDSHYCTMKIGSYLHSDNFMLFSTPVLEYDDTNKSVILDFTAEIYPLEEADTWIRGRKNVVNYSMAGFKMRLHRNSLKYVINYYLPSAMFVVVSWVSFLIPPEVIPGRMAMLVTLFLVLVNLFSSVITNSPKAESLTAISSWMLVCLLFVFGALSGYAAILIMLYRTSRGTISGADKMVVGQPYKDGARMKKIDTYLLIFFPLLFLIYNIIYWVTLM
jgi:hypothetical protein